MLETQGGTDLKIMTAGVLGCLYAVTNDKYIIERVSGGVKIDGTDNLKKAYNSALFAAVLKHNPNDQHMLGNMLKIAKDTSSPTEALQHTANAIGFMLKHSFKTGETVNFRDLFDNLYKNEPLAETKRQVWNAMTWAIYTSFPIAIEVDTNDIDPLSIAWVCEKAVTSGAAKNETNTTVKKAADEVILACVSQFGYKYVVKHAGQNSAVDAALGGRLSKMIQQKQQKAGTAVNYHNIDPTVMVL